MTGYTRYDTTASLADAAGTWTGSYTKRPILSFYLQSKKNKVVSFSYNKQGSPPDYPKEEYSNAQAS
jgi:hypothetical protein